MLTKFLSPVLLLLLGITTGCIRDGENDCIENVVIYVSVAESESRSSIFTDNEQPDAENATVYIFGTDSRLERVVTLSKEDIINRTPIEITIYNGRFPQVVVWGNLNGAQDVSEPVNGLHLSTARVNMIEKDGYTLPIDNLYYGFKKITSAGIREVFITSWVGRILISVRGIEDIRSNANDYYFTINSKYSGYDFYGGSKAGEALVKVDAVYNVNQQDEWLIHEPVNFVAYPVIPGERQSMEVKLYKRTAAGDVLIASVDTDIEGKRIVTHPGENTNVLLDFTDQSGINVYLKFTPWDHIHQWVVW